MEQDLRNLDLLLEERIRENGYSGVAVYIRGPEGVIYQRGFGYRCMEPQKPVDENTIFGIASMSKSMTALACCILHAEGKMSLEDPLVKYFPDLHLPGIPDECVTVRQLGLHRAGIPPMEPLEWSIAMNSIVPETEQHRQLIATAPNKMDHIDQIVEYLTEGKYGSMGEPGEYMSYSNEGYALLCYVVDQAAGMTLEQFLMERIFQPLGMNRTILDLDGSQARVLAGDDNVTSLFEKNEDGAIVWDDHFSVLPPYRGCACVKSTTSDLSKYYQMLSNRGVFEGKRIVADEAIELMLGSAYPLRKKPFYCMGLKKSLLNGKLMCEHAGDLHGTSTIGGFIEGGYSAVVLCNQGGQDMQNLQWICYNYILGLPLEREHYWAMPSGRNFSAPEMLCGDYVAHEGIPVHCIISCEGHGTDGGKIACGTLSCQYGGQEMLLRYCDTTVFAVYDASDPETRVNTFRFFLRDGRAWGVKCGSRIYQRVSND